jgi:hypothetical protein
VEKKGEKNLNTESKSRSEKTEEEARKELMAEVSCFPHNSAAESTIFGPSLDETNTNTTQKASLLRTRLQLALYKVQTNQTSTPFPRLRQNSTKSPRPKSPQLPPMSSSPMSSPRRDWRSLTMSPESKIAIARAKATMQVKPVVRKLGDIVQPTINPTGFSARVMVANVRDDGMGREVPSSPPMSGGNGAEEAIVELIRPETPSPAAKPRSRSRKEGKGKEEVPSTPKQLSSPPGSPELGTTVKRLKMRETDGEGAASLTSSVVKGQAASGLLELMRGGGGHGDGD